MFVGGHREGRQHGDAEQQRRHCCTSLLHCLSPLSVAQTIVRLCWLLHRLVPVLQAERHGVCAGWRIGKVNGTAMPSTEGAEHTIHAHIGEIKRTDKRIVIVFEVAPASATPQLPVKK